MKSIRTKLTINVLFISLLAMAIVTSISYVVARNTIVLESTHKFTNLTRANAQNINGWFNEQSTVLQSVSIDLSALDNVSDIPKITVAQTEKNDSIIVFYAGFSDGSYAFGDYWTENGYDVLTRPWYSKAIEGNNEVVFTSPYVDAIDGEIIVSASKSNEDFNNKQYVLAMDFKMSLLADILNNKELPKKSYSFLVDNSGNIIYHSDPIYAPTKEGMKLINDIDAYKTLLNKKDNNNIIIKDYDGILRYFFPQTIAATDWVLYTAVPSEEIIAPSMPVLYSVIPVYLLVSFFVVLFIWIIVDRTIVKPINTLGIAMKKLSEGDLSVELNVETNDELGWLSNGIKVMVNVLNDMLDNISNMTQKHQAGYSSYQIDQINFEGAYKSVIDRINSMTIITNKNFNELLSLMQNFGSGHFDAIIKDFPGDQSIGNEIVESLRSNLKNVNIEINNFVEAAVLGQLSFRADNKKFEGDWKEMMVGFNKVLSSIADPIHEVSNAIEQLSKGNLDTEITMECSGDFLVMKNAMNLSTKTLKYYINEISFALGKISNKDITYQIENHYLGDFVAIKNSIILINNNLKSIIGELANTSIGVNEEISNLSSANENVSKGAIKQAELVSALNENVTKISQQNKQNVENTNSAFRLFEYALENVDEANAEMNSMLTSMDDIASASKDISNIIKVIEDIAFQTNLLALNASIEAARAGSHGAGFAVVADEVRSLANRSQEAAQKSNDLIIGSVSAVEVGMSKANDTSNILMEITQSIKKVSNIITIINHSSAHQNEEVLQAEMSITEIADIAQNNTKIVLENTMHTEEVSKQAHNLTDMLNQFKLEK